MIKNLKKKKGFTLIELIIVIAILGILVAIAVPKFGNVQESAKIKSDVATAKSIADTTLMLLAQDKLTGTYSSAADLGTDITDSLQSGTNTTPKSVAGKFRVQVTSGIVTVTIVPSEAKKVNNVDLIKDTSYQVYPTPATAWQ